MVTVGTVALLSLLVPLPASTASDDARGAKKSEQRPTGRLLGAGSSLVDPLMQKWQASYAKATKQAVNYQTKGSGAGIRMMVERDVDFGCTDAVLTDEQLTRAKGEGGEVLHIPLCLGAVVPIYNVPGVTDLTFDGNLLIEIYLGTVKNWNDPAVARLNPGKKLPDLAILVVWRSDMCSATGVLTGYFTSVNARAWTPGRGTEVRFPTGIGGKGNDGVIGVLTKEKGAIGYADLSSVAGRKNLSLGRVKNSKGKAIQADVKSLRAAAASAKVPADLRRFSPLNAPGAEAYPLTGVHWAVCYARQPAGKAEALRQFLHWVTHDGQKECEALHLGRLPGPVVKQIEKRLKLIVTAKAE